MIGYRVTDRVVVGGDGCFMTAIVGLVTIAVVALFIYIGLIALVVAALVTAIWAVFWAFPYWFWKAMIEGGMPPWAATMVVVAYLCLALAAAGVALVSVIGGFG